MQEQENIQVLPRMFLCVLVANKWIHEYGQEFKHRCSLNPEEWHESKCALGPGEDQLFIIIIIIAGRNEATAWDEEGAVNSVKGLP